VKALSRVLIISEVISKVVSEAMSDVMSDVVSEAMSDVMSDVLFVRAQFFSVLIRCHAGPLLEDAEEVFFVIVADRAGDLGEFLVRIFQKLFRAFDAYIT